MNVYHFICIYVYIYKYICVYNLKKKYHYKQTILKYSKGVFTYFLKLLIN